MYMLTACACLTAEDRSRNERPIRSDVKRMRRSQTSALIEPNQYSLVHTAADTFPVLVLDHDIGLKRLMAGRCESRIYQAQSVFCLILGPFECAFGLCAAGTLSVCLSRAGFVSKLLHIIINFFHPLLGPSFRNETALQNSDNALNGTLNTSRIRKIAFLDPYQFLTQKRYRIRH